MQAHCMLCSRELPMGSAALVCDACIATVEQWPEFLPEPDVVIEVNSEAT